jgi:16S rRNA (uracil1498-N3)-methyltransferase
MITVLAGAGSLVPGERVIITADEEHHLAVRRAQAGEPVRVLDGAGARAEGRLLPGDKGRIAVQLGQVEHEPRPVPMVLAVGAGDRDRFALLVEQAAQLGATAVIPLETERSASVAGRLKGAHLERIRRRGREAIKQCDTAWAPVVAEPVPLGAFLAQPPTGARWLAERDAGPPRALGSDEPLVVAVGPEGGFTAAERDLLLSAGFVAVRLGPHLLRFETAALAALTTAWLARQRDQHG